MGFEDWYLVWHSKLKDMDLTLFYLLRLLFVFEHFYFLLFAFRKTDNSLQRVDQSVDQAGGLFVYTLVTVPLQSLEVTCDIWGVADPENDPWLQAEGSTEQIQPGSVFISDVYPFPAWGVASQPVCVLVLITPCIEEIKHLVWAIAFPRQK